MADNYEYEETLAYRGVPIVGNDGSASEEEDQEEETEVAISADDIRQARTVVTARADALPDITNPPRTRLTFSLEAPVARNTSGLAEDPRPSEPRPLDRYEQVAMETGQPAGSSDPGNAACIYSCGRFASRVARSNG